MNTIKRRVELTAPYGASIQSILSTHHKYSKQSKVTLWDIAQIKYSMERKSWKQ